MTSTALVGPVQVLTFPYPGHPRAVRIPYNVPVNTCDQRAKDCFDHHPACDCREAQLQEEITELLMEARDARAAEQALRAVAFLHPRPHPGRLNCTTCYDLWPCPTRRLVDPLVPEWARPEATS